MVGVSLGLLGYGWCAYDVEALRPCLLDRAQERERRGRRAARRRRVVAARRRVAAGDALAGDERAVHAGDDRIADARVVDRALDAPAAADLLPLRHQPDREVRLVPRRPQPNARKDRAVGALERAAVALGCGEREVLEVDRVPRRVRRELSAIRPRRRPEDREEDLDALVGGIEDDAVVLAPVVRGIGRVGRVRGADADDAEPAAPVQLHAQHLGMERAEHGVERRRLLEVGAAAVGDAELQAPCRRRRRCEGRRREHDGSGEHEESTRSTVTGRC